MQLYEAQSDLSPHIFDHICNSLLGKHQGGGLGGKKEGNAHTNNQNGKKQQFSVKKIKKSATSTNGGN